MGHFLKNGFQLNGFENFISIMSIKRYLDITANHEHLNKSPWVLTIKLVCDKRMILRSNVTLV